MNRKSLNRQSVCRYEKLEQRQLLASISLDSGSLIVGGDSTDDVIELIGNPDLQRFTVRVNSDPSLTETFRYADVTQLTVFAGGGNDRVTNTLRLDTQIYGGPGNDYLEGGFRDDLLFGGDGRDILVGRNGADTLRGQGGLDWIYGGPGTDSLFGFSGNDRLFGGPGNDRLFGDAGNDDLYGQDGDDLLLGGTNNDRLFGESGNDELAGQNGNDFLVGGTGEDRLFGNAGNDLLNGSEDNDIINAGPGNDTANGGLGDDLITGIAGANILNGNGGNDRINGGSAADRIQGGSGNDVLAGNAGQDTLIGGPGNDQLQGHGGNDLINGNAGNDTISAGLGNDTVNGGLGNDVITGVAGVNILNGNGGDDRINGGRAVDTIEGGSGDDFLAGGEGNDVIVGGHGIDRIFGGPGSDHLSGGEGSDFLYGQQGSDLLIGDQGNDQIFGNDGNDEIHATFGNDRVNGNGGSDILYYFADEAGFEVIRVGTGFRVTDPGTPDPQRVGTYGIDLLTDIEELAFGDPSNFVTRPIVDTLTQFDDSSEIATRINEALPAGWQSRVRIVGNDVWIRTVRPNGTAHLDFRFGSAGVIAEIRDVRSGRSLLAPSFNGEITDRVVQWTLWEAGPTVRHDVPSLPDFEDRFNVTQAGTFENVLNGTVDVDVNAQEGQVDVWSVVDHNWRSEQNPHMDGTITALTRTTVLDGGAILVRRILRIGEIRLNGRPVSIANPFFEAWTPFSDSEFDSIALSFDGNGNPNRSFLDGHNIPRYPHINVSNTRGWATSFDSQNTSGGNNLSVVFGTDKGTVQHADGTQTDSRFYQLNTLDFEGGMGILPALFPGSLSEGAIIDQHLILLPGQNINAATAAQLDALAEEIPPPRTYHPGAELSGELADIADRLSTLTGERRVATDNIGRLI